MNFITDLSIIEHLLRNATQEPEQIESFADWKNYWKIGIADQWQGIDRAIAGGLAADRPAWFFTSGYQSAIYHLLGKEDDSKIAALCITEKGPPHPKNIKTWLSRIDVCPGHWRIDGEKSFVSGGEQADILWVAVTSGTTEEGRNVISIVRIPSDCFGITFTPRPSIGIVPETPHARVKFEAVTFDDEAILPGDGYLDVIKPFRTVEDLHVTTAYLAWIFGIGQRNSWPTEIAETIIALICNARSLTQADPNSPALHLALGGFLAQVRELTEKTEPLWYNVGAEIREAWQRDRNILSVAEIARQKRLSTAREYYLEHIDN